MTGFFQKLHKSVKDVQMNQTLSRIPPARTWFSHVENDKLRHSYIHDVEHFIRFADIKKLKDFRNVTSATIHRYRYHLQETETTSQKIWQKLIVLSALMSEFKRQKAITINPCDAVVFVRPDAYVGSLNEELAELLLCAPSETLSGIRDRAILAVLLYHTISLEEVSRLRIKDLRQKQGIPHFRLVNSQREVRYIPIHPSTLKLMYIYRTLDDRVEDDRSPLFRALDETADHDQALDHTQLKAMVERYALNVGMLHLVICQGYNSLRAINARKALDKASDISNIKKRLGSKHTGLFRLYDPKLSNPKNGPVFNIEL